MSTTEASVSIFGSGASLPIRGISAATTLNANDYTVIANATSAAFAVTLPSAGAIPGRIYVVKKGDSSGNAVTVTATSGDNIDGSATRALSVANAVVAIQSDGINTWHVIWAI